MMEAKEIEKIEGEASLPKPPASCGCRGCRLMRGEYKPYLNPVRGSWDSSEGYTRERTAPTRMTRKELWHLFLLGHRGLAYGSSMHIEGPIVYHNREIEAVLTPKGIIRAAFCLGRVSGFMGPSPCIQDWQAYNERVEPIARIPLSDIAAALTASLRAADNATVMPTIGYEHIEVLDQRENDGWRNDFVLFEVPWRDGAFEETRKWQRVPMLFGYDSGPRSYAPHYGHIPFLVMLEDSPKTVPDAFAMLRPVCAEEDYRQGEWFFYKMPEGFRPACVRNPWTIHPGYGNKQFERRIQFNHPLDNHNPTRLGFETYRLVSPDGIIHTMFDDRRTYKTDGPIYVRGTVRHLQHGMLKLGNGQDWYAAAKSPYRGVQVRIRPFAGGGLD